MEREPEQLFLDDFSAGQTYPGQPRTITKDDILSFAALTGDAHPIHYDDGPNIYAYVHGDPVNAIDPSGRNCEFPDTGDCIIVVDVSEVIVTPLGSNPGAANSGDTGISARLKITPGRSLTAYSKGTGSRHAV